MAPHHSARRARRAADCTQFASITTREALQRTCSSPAIQFISSREVVSTCVRLPVSGSVFVDKPVRVDAWNGAVIGVRVEFMAPMVDPSARAVHIQKTENQI